MSSLVITTFGVFAVTFMVKQCANPTLMAAESKLESPRSPRATLNL